MYDDAPKLPFAIRPNLLASPAINDASTSARPVPPAGGAAILWLVAVTLIALTGCRSQAYREVYQQRMQSEIRTLEDQLYEADYHNQVLIDELERAQRKIEYQASKRADSNGRAGRGGATDRSATGQSAGPSVGDGTGDAADGQPSVRQRRLPARPTHTDPFQDDQLPAPATDDNDSTQMLEPPQIHLPPGPDDLSFQDVEYGPPVPPAGVDAIEELPPGQVILPVSLQRHVIVPLPQPVSIRIDAARSGGWRYDDSLTARAARPDSAAARPDSAAAANDNEAANESGEAEVGNDSGNVTGIQLTIEAIDEAGDPVDLSEFEVVGQLSVVLLDPERAGSEARLGRWDFEPEQLQTMVHRGSNRALHVYLPWQDQLPLGAEVIAHVKLTEGDAQMQAQATLKTAATEIVGWNPRGETMQR